MDEANRPATKGSLGERNGANQDEALMGCGTEAIAEGKKDESCEDQDIGQADDVKEFGIYASRAYGVRGMPHELFGRRPNAEDHHHTREQKARDAQAPVDVDPTSRDQGNLHNEQKDPTGHDCAVNMDDWTRQRGAEDPGYIVTVREAEKDRAQYENSHGGKKILSKRRPATPIEGGRSKTSVALDIATS